jgi:hypothetical protein
MAFSRWVRFTAMLLLPVLIGSSVAFAAGKPVDPMAIRAKVQAHGVGQGIRVSLADNTEVKGLIVSIGDQSFVVKAKGAAQPQEIQYAQVIAVHNAKMGTGTRVIIAVAIVGAVVGIAAAVFDHEFKAGFPKTIPVYRRKN